MIHTFKILITNIITTRCKRCKACIQNQIIIVVSLINVDVSRIIIAISQNHADN